MIKSTKVIALPLFEDEKENTFIQVEFSDGSFVNLNEEELKNAAALAEKGCLSD